MQRTTIINLYYAILAMAVFAMVALTVFQSSQAVVYGRSVAQLESQQHTLQQQQLALRQQLAGATSLRTAQTLAMTQGFEPTAHLLSLSTTTQVALR